MDVAEAIRDAIRDAGTQLGDRIYKPGDWPSQDAQYPLGRVRLIREDRRSPGRGGPDQFVTTALVLVSLEVSALALADNDGAAEAEQQLWAIKREVDAAIFNNAAIGALISQYPAISAELAYTSEAATHLAGLQLKVSAEFFEGADNFAGAAEPAPLDDLDEITVADTELPPAGARFFNLQN